MSAQHVGQDGAKASPVRSDVGPGEWADVAAEAEELGVDAPPVTRVALPDTHPGVSALRWREGPAEAVLLHGGALNAHTWDATLLSWQVPALAVDLPGHGDSDWRADESYRPQVLADQLAPGLGRLVDDGELRPDATLVGQSLGGLVALVLAATGGSWSRVVLGDVLPLPPGAAAQGASFLAGPAAFASRDEIVQRALAFGLGGSPTRLERGVRLNTRVRDDGSVVWKHHLGALAADGRLDPTTFASEELWSRIRSLRQPVDLVLGERGIVPADLLTRFTQVVPSATVTTLDSGHNVQEDRPGELAAVLAGLTGRA